MQKELWDKIKDVNAGKMEISEEEAAKLISEGYQMIIDDTEKIARLEGAAEVYVSGAKGLIGAGVLWYAVGKLRMYMARKIRDQYDPY